MPTGTISTLRRSVRARIPDSDDEEVSDAGHRRQPTARSSETDVTTSSQSSLAYRDAQEYLFDDDDDDSSSDEEESQTAHTSEARSRQGSNFEPQSKPDTASVTSMINRFADLKSPNKRIVDLSDSPPRVSKLEVQPVKPKPQAKAEPVNIFLKKQERHHSGQFVRHVDHNVRGGNMNKPRIAMYTPPLQEAGPPRNAMTSDQMDAIIRQFRQCQNTSPNTPPSRGLQVARPWQTPERALQKSVRSPTQSPYAENTRTAGESSGLVDLCETLVDLDTLDLKAPLPSALTKTLLHHQLIGVAWMRMRESGKAKGGILADEMGLGKTGQTISLILANRPEKVIGKPFATLVVVPLAVKEQWREEIEEWTEQGTLRVLVHQGSKRTKKVSDLEEYDIIITTYDVLASDYKDPEKAVTKTKAPASPAKSKNAQEDLGETDSEDSFIVNDTPKKSKAKSKSIGPLYQMKFHRIVLDEAHRIRNSKTTAAKACFALKAEFRWCLSGTPIQNDCDDLFSLFHFLGDTAKPFNDRHTFRLQISEPLTRNRGVIVNHRIRTAFDTLLLRRKKDTILNGKVLLELPSKTVQIVSVPFADPDEEIFYRALNDRVQAQLNKFDKRGEIHSQYMAVWTWLLRMRQATTHPILVTKKYETKPNLGLFRSEISSDSDSDDDVDDLALQFTRVQVKDKKKCLVCWGKISNGRYCDQCDERIEHFGGGTASSTKMDMTIALLKTIRNEKGNKKTIVFSQWTSAFSVLEPMLHRNNFTWVTYTGSMNIDQREAALHAIKTDPKCTVILISLMCGSLGLNLTECSRVIVMDLWEMQAIDRAHRFGQQDEVKVWKLSIKNTIEERLLEMQEQKSAMAAAALNDGGKMKRLNKLNVQEMVSLLRGR